MNKIFSVSFWIQLFLSTFLTMVMVYIIKRTIGNTNIPIVSTIAQEV